MQLSKNKPSRRMTDETWDPSAPALIRNPSRRWACPGVVRSA